MMAGVERTWNAALGGLQALVTRCQHDDENGGVERMKEEKESKALRSSLL